MYRFWAVLGLSLALFAPLGAEPKKPVNERNWKKILAHVVPEPSECRWQKIPWRESLWEGVIDGQKRKMPILLWAMNGHPLGCT